MDQDQGLTGGDGSLRDPGNLGMTSSQVEHIIVKIFAVKASGVMTNVIGPRQPIYFAGQMMKGMVFWFHSLGQLRWG